jgi:hypothetical protein
MFKLANQECSRLRVDFRAQEDDRQFLVRQAVGLKRENARLREDLQAYQHDFEDIMRAADKYEWAGPSPGGADKGPGGAPGGGRPGKAAAGSRPGTAAGRGGGGAPGPRLPGAQGGEEAPEGGGEGAALEERLQRCEKVVQSLRRMADTERRRARQVGCRCRARSYRRPGGLPRLRCLCWRPAGRRRGMHPRTHVAAGGVPRRRTPSWSWSRAAAASWRRCSRPTVCGWTFRRSSSSTTTTTRQAAKQQQQQQEEAKASAAAGRAGLVQSPCRPGQPPAAASRAA